MRQYVLGLVVTASVLGLPAAFAEAGEWQLAKDWGEEALYFKAGSMESEVVEHRKLLRFWFKKTYENYRLSLKDDRYNETIGHMEVDCAEKKHRFLELTTRYNGTLVDTFTEAHATWQYTEPDDWLMQVSQSFCK